MNSLISICSLIPTIYSKRTTLQIVVGVIIGASVNSDYLRIGLPKKYNVVFTFKMTVIFCIKPFLSEPM